MRQHHRDNSEQASQELIKHMSMPLYESDNPPTDSEKLLLSVWSSIKKQRKAELLEAISKEAKHPWQLDQRTIFFDLETTGLDIETDRIVSIAIIILSPDGNKSTWEQLVNPGIPISAEATAVHGITDSQIQKRPTFAKCATALSKLFKDATLVGFNINQFDIPLLNAELLRAGIIQDWTSCKTIDLMQILHKDYPKRDLALALKVYAGKDLSNAHNAAADTNACYQIFRGLDRANKRPLAQTLPALPSFSAPTAPAQRKKATTYYQADKEQTFTDKEAKDWLRLLQAHKGKRFDTENSHLLRQPNNGRMGGWYKSKGANCPLCESKKHTVIRKAEYIDQGGWGWRCMLHLSTDHKDIIAKLVSLQDKL